ncbi:MAG: DNA-processing protein DprA [Eubacteriales bacterium]|nr:DNA-processing protein DprA [Eubacteriales bacterium]
MQQTTIYWLWLATRPGCTVRFLNRLLDQFGEPEAVWRAKQEQLSGFPRMNHIRMESLLEKDLTHVNRIAHDCQKQQIHIVTQEDNQYPAPLRQIADPPLVLYVRGTMPDFDHKLAISVVGTRSCTPYGLHAARYFAGRLAQNGCIVVSGMALGIDGAANQAALDADGETVAVLGCGVDVCYPWQHETLMADIVRHGAVISEYPPGTEPKGKHFPNRNRIITGLSRGTLVVEAPKKSGALISADLALDQGREVFAVPGDINRPSCAGCNFLIRQGGAGLVQEPADILAHYGREDQTYASAQKRREPPAARLASRTQMQRAKQDQVPLAYQNRKLDVSPEERAVWMAVHDGHGTVDAIVEETGLPAAVVLTALTMLEVNAYVIATGGGYRPAADIQP